MDHLYELAEKQAVLTEELQTLENKVSYTEREIKSTEESIKELKLQRDTAAFKFVRSKMADILLKIAPKHKIPMDREISVPISNDSNMTVKVPYTKDKECSDEDPFNVSICPRCALLHFSSIMDRTIAEYYS